MKQLEQSPQFKLLKWSTLLIFFLSFILIQIYFEIGLFSARLKRFIMAAVTIEASLKEIVETFSSYWHVWQTFSFLI